MQVGKILLNALIYKGIKMNVKKSTVASIFHTSVSNHCLLPSLHTYTHQKKITHTPKKKEWKIWAAVCSFITTC